MVKKNYNNSQINIKGSLTAVYVKLPYENLDVILY